MDFYAELAINLLKYLLKRDTNIENIRIIKKISDNFDKNGDLRCPLKLLSWKAFIKNQEESTHILNESQLEILVNESRIWKFPIQKIELVEKTDSIIFYLNRVLTIQRTFQNVLDQGKNFGTFVATNPKVYNVTKTSINDNSLLSDLRVHLVAECAENFIKTLGHQVIENQNTAKEIHFVSRNSKADDGHKNGVRILCGTVNDNISGNKASQLTKIEFYSQRKLDMRLFAEHKYGVRVTAMPTWREVFDKLGHSAVTIELLQIKPTNVVKINMNNPTDSNNKGPAFILYNCARISSILQKFDKLATEHGIRLPPLDEIDVTLLNQPEEWELVYNYIFYYPTMVKSCIYDIDNGNVNPQYICSFLFELCSKFSMYYRRIRILTQLRPHMLPTMYARIYLLQNLQQILHNALNILNIEPIAQM